MKGSQDAQYLVSSLETIRNFTTSRVVKIQSQTMHHLVLERLCAGYPESLRINLHRNISWVWIPINYNRQRFRKIIVHYSTTAVRSCDPFWPKFDWSYSDEAKLYIIRINEGTLNVLIQKQIKMDQRKSLHDQLITAENHEVNFGLGGPLVGWSYRSSARQEIEIPILSAHIEQYSVPKCNQLLHVHNKHHMR